MTSSASRSWGTTFGCTNEVTSIRGTPASARRFTTSILCSVGMKSGSIWNPSRVPTSQIVTRSGSFILASALLVASAKTVASVIDAFLPRRRAPVVLRIAVDDPSRQLHEQSLRESRHVRLVHRAQLLERLLRAVGQELRQTLGGEPV